MKNYNNIDMKGRLYNYALEEIENDKGTAIAGEVTVEVDDEGTTVAVRFFAYPTFNNGKTNKTYGILEDMMAGKMKSVTEDGDEAEWIALTGSIDVSYFVARNSTDDELARAQKLRGAFINPNKDKKYSNKWKLDLLMTNVKDVEADEEKHLDRFVKVTGYLIDDYNKRVMEVQFQARTEGAMNYIIGLEPSYEAPHFASTWGKVAKLSRLVVRKNAFGEDETDEYASTQWVITGMNPEPYAFGDEATITVDTYTEFREALDEHKEAQKNKDEDGGGSGSGKKELAF